MPGSRIRLSVFFLLIMQTIVLPAKQPGQSVPPEQQSDRPVPPEQPEIIRSWRLTGMFTETERVEIDTMATAFQVHSPLFKEAIAYSFLGNMGLAAMPDIFTRRGLMSDFFFIDPFIHYLPSSSETRYYNTRRPFSLIDFSTGGPRGKNEKILNILHTQNVNPDFNLGFRYFNINSEGQYRNQDAVTNAISLFGSYELENYQLYASLNLNSARVFENGGLSDPSSLLNPDFETEDHLVRIDARNYVNNNGILISQSWQPFFYTENDTVENGSGSWLEGLRLYHVVRYDRYRRTYDDNFPGAGFYPEVLINTSRTFDSVAYATLTNKVMVELPPFSRGIVSFNARGGIKNEIERGSYSIPPDTIFHFDHTEPPASFLLAEPSDFTIIDRREHRYGSNALIALAQGGIGDVFGIWGEGSLFFQGRRAGEYDLNAGISFDLFEGRNRSVLEASVRQREITPSLFMNSYYSNHFAWNNDFRRTGESVARGRLLMPGRDLEASVSFRLLNNFIYFDRTANLRQHGDVIPVMNVSLKKDFSLWRFHFRNITEYQVSGNKEVLPLPDLSVYQSAWYEHSFIDGMLTVQAGFDIWYSTRYQGYAYQPAISAFYPQDERMFGNYPYIDAFISFKHKRLRGFFKVEHLNAGFIYPDYFTVLHYPRNHRMFKLGVSWSFYN